MGDPPRPALKQARINFPKASDDSTTKPASSSSSSTTETSSSGKRVPPACHDSTHPMKQARLSLSTASTSKTESSSLSIQKMGKDEGDYVPAHHSLSTTKASVSTNIMDKEAAVDIETKNKKSRGDMAIWDTYKAMVEKWGLEETTTPRSYQEIPLTWSHNDDQLPLWLDPMFNHNSGVLPFLNKVGVSLQCWRSFARQQALVTAVWLAWAYQRGDVDDEFLSTKFPSIGRSTVFDVLGPAGLLGNGYSPTFRGSFTADDGALARLASQRLIQTVKSINVAGTIAMILKYPHHPTHAALLTSIKESNTAALPPLMGPAFPAIGCHSQSSSAKRFELLPFILKTASELSAWIEHDHERARRQLATRLGRKGTRTVIWALLAHDYRPFPFHWLMYLDDRAVTEIMVQRIPRAVAKGIEKIGIEDLITDDTFKRINANRPAWSEADRQRRAARPRRSGRRKRTNDRVYWKRMARQAALRSFNVKRVSELDDKQRAAFQAECRRIFPIVVRLALKAPRCYYCRVKLTFIAYEGKKTSNVESEEELAHFATNASLEAIVPRHAGGGYDEDNATLACTPCNLLKMGWRADNFRVFLSELVKAQRTVDGNLLIPQRPPMTRPLDQGEIDEVKDLLRLRRDGIIAGHKAGNRAECKLTTDQMFGEVRDQCLPNNMYADPCGLVLPIYVAHIDRVKSSRPYEPGNLRLYYAGFNIAKRNFNTDLVPLIYLKNLQENFDPSSVEALVAAGVEPLVASTFFGNSKHRSAFTEVFQLPDFSSLFADDDEDDDEEEEEEDDEE